MAAIALAAVLMAAVLIALVSGPSASAATTQNSSTFISILDTSVSTFNPFVAFEQGEIDTDEMIYPYLVFGNQAGNPAPYLATSWSLSPNHLKWTFHLRAGLKWSDGVPLTSRDVAWTYNLIMHNATAATANGTLVSYFKTVTAPNPSTVVITTTVPVADLLNDVEAIAIVPEHIWKSKVKNIGSFTNTALPIVGYGPYRLTRYQPSQSVTFTANPDFFWKGEPAYHTLILDYFANGSAGYAAVLKGTVDSTANLTPTEWKSLQGKPGIKTYQTVTNDWIAVEINGHAMTRTGKPIGNGNPLLHNPVIRRAIALGINRAVILKKVADGAGVETGSYLTPAYPQWYWTPSPSQAQNYDPTKANAMLTAAGFPLGKNGIRYDKKTGKPLSFRLGIHTGDPSDASTANYLVGWMKDIGIQLNVQAMSNTQLNDNLAVGDWDLLMDQWPEGPDPTYLLSIQTCGVLPQNADGSGGNTDSFFCNHKYDQLYAEEQRQFNQAKRVQEVKEMEQILYNADYDIILYDDAQQWATRDNYLKGNLYGKPNAQGLYPLQNYELEWITAVPEAAISTGGSSSSTGIIIGVIVVVLLGGGALITVLRRRVGADEQE